MTSPSDPHRSANGTGDVCITLDIDWAPDFVIDEIADVLVRANVRATWFVTHASPAVARLAARRGLFELGIHPNFLAGSTHGRTTRDVLKHCLELVPDATCMRTHSLVQSSGILATVIEETPIRADLSLFLPDAPVAAPIRYWHLRRFIDRIPYTWEDDAEMQRPSPRWSLANLRPPERGPWVLDFHPIHVHLNACELSPYQRLKERSPDLKAATPADSADLIRSGRGPGTLFREVVNQFARSGRSRTVRELRVDRDLSGRAAA